MTNEEMKFFDKICYRENIASQKSNIIVVCIDCLYKANCQSILLKVEVKEEEEEEQ